jgi:hypothetical protein
MVWGSAAWSVSSSGSRAARAPYEYRLLEEDVKALGVKVCVLAAGACCVFGQARAIDIPMDAKLAEERLDSKTCYAVLKAGGKLVGYEMASDLLISSGGRLLAVPAATGHDIGDGLPRRYEGEGLRLDITPLNDKRTDTVPNVSYTIKERADAVLIENGKRRRFRLDVLLSCS